MTRIPKDPSAIITGTGSSYDALHCPSSPWPRPMGDAKTHVLATLLWNAEEPAAVPDRRLRLTMGRRKVHGHWTILHEHHSFTARD